MRALLLMSLFLLLWAGCSQPKAAIAHPVGLNSEDCHNNRKTGGYHCHRGPASSAGAARSNLASRGFEYANCVQARAAGAAPVRTGTFEHHLMCDGTGQFPIEFGSSWERDVLEAEMARDGFVGWYRNPSRSSQESLAVAYDVGGAYRLLRPDFLFFAELPDGSIAADIVDPHGTHFSDALPKLRALARYAAEHPNTYRRIESIAKVGDQLRLLDLTDPHTREAVGSATSAAELYRGSSASAYP